jgi:hypothetical protein
VAVSTITQIVIVAGVLMNVISDVVVIPASVPLTLAACAFVVGLIEPA